MLRRGLIISALLLAVPVAGAAWVYSPALLRVASDVTPASVLSSLDKTSAQPSDLDALKPRDGTATTAGFDVARISPDGWSVFAGTAPPNSSVTVIADGRRIGTAKADEHGEWTLLSDHRFASTDPALNLEVEKAPVVAAGGGTEVVADKRADPQRPQAMSGVSERMLRDFEGVVAAARDLTSSPKAIHAPVPVPIQFVYREATFTEEGDRAAELLLEYLKLTNPKSIILTGHADERGTEQFNYKLSRQRLDAVAEYLRRGGFEGRLELIPKGNSEPYQGVDRTSLDKATLWQLDRRVELQLGAEPPFPRSAQDAYGSGARPKR